MPKKLYSMHGTAQDANGNPHVVTIVGQFETTKTPVVKYEDVIVDVSPTKNVEGKLVYETKQPIRKLTYAYSICHPDDKFDEQTGINIAKRRIKSSPMGELTTKYVTSLCKDQIELILFGELKFILDNIDMFLDKWSANKTEE